MRVLPRTVINQVKSKLLIQNPSRRRRENSRCLFTVLNATLGSKSRETERFKEVLKGVSFETVVQRRWESIAVNLVLTTELKT